MQVFNEKFYTPVTIKLETQEEFNMMWIVANHATYINRMLKENFKEVINTEYFLSNLWKKLDATKQKY